MASLPPVAIPVVAAPAGGAATTAATAQAAAANQGVAVAATEATAAINTQTSATVKKAAAEVQVTAATKAAALADTELAAAEAILLKTQERLAVTISANALARTELSGTTAALIPLNRALTAAEAAGDDDRVRRIAGLEAEVVARRNAAAAAIEQARADVTQARTSATAGRGAAATALSLGGLRGATLAASGPFLAGAVAAAAFAKAIGIATSFNSEISVLGAVTGATADEMERASGAAKEFGRDITLPGVSAGDAATTITEFSKAGLSLNESIAATRGGLQLATAANIDYADAVQLSANALNVFGLSGNQAVHVSDTLANAANLAQGSIEDVGLAFSQSAAAAQVVGVSFEDTIALLTLLARNGLTGSDAGTALRTSFIRLVNPSKEAKEILSELNINLRDVQGNVRPEVFQEFAEAQRNLTVAQQQANIAIVFGQDAFRAFGAIAQEPVGALDQVRAGLAVTGTAAKVASARMTGLKGATANLQNQLENFGLVVGEVAEGPLAALVNRLADFVGGVPDAIQGAQDLAEALKDMVPPAPAGVDQPGRNDDPLGVATTILKRGFQLGNIVGQANTVRKFLADQRKDTEDEAKQTGVDIRDAIESAGREAAQGALSFQSDIVAALQPGFEQINQALRAGAAKVRAGAIAAVKGGQGQAAGLEEAFNQIVAGGGGDQAQIAALKQQAAVQAKIIADAGPDAAGVQLEARREAQAKLASIESQITSIEEGIAADQKAARDERERIRKENKQGQDQAFLEAQADARSQQERLVSLAADTEGVADDIRRQEQLRTLIVKQISALKASALDEKTKQAALKTLRAAKQATTDEINRLRVTEAEERVAEKQRGLDAQVALAEATGNVALQRKLIQVQINGINAEIAAGKLRGAALNEAKVQRATLQAQQEDLQDQGIQSQIALGQSILDLTGNKNPLLKALNAAVAETRKDIAAAKKAGRSTVDLQTELNNFLKTRKDVIEGAKKEAGQGTTAFDLLTQAAQTFQTTGGNLIGGNQPFAGPTGFTADIAQFLQRQRPTAGRITTDKTTGAGIERQTAATVSLTTSIDRLRESVDRSHGNSTVGVGGLSGAAVDALGQRGNALAKFWEARGARQTAEG